MQAFRLHYQNSYILSRQWLNMDYTHKGWRYRSEDADEYLDRQLAANPDDAIDIETVREYIAAMRIQRDIGDLRAVGIANILCQTRRLAARPYCECSTADIYGAIAKLKTRRKPDGNKYSANTLNLNVMTLRAFLFWLVEAGRSSLPYKDVAQIKVPKRNETNFTPDDVLTEDEVRLILDHCRTPRDKAFIALLYDGGLRTVDIAEMVWKDLTFNEGYVTLRTDAKTGIERVVHLTQSVSALQAWREQYPGSPTGDNALFVSQRGRPLTYGAAAGIKQRLVKRIKEDTGIDLTGRLSLHQFRRASITHEAARGRPIHHICMEKWGRAHSEQIKRYLLPGEDEIIDSKLEASGITREKRKYQKRSPVAPVQCASCGKIWDAGTKYCTCGTPLSPDAMDEVRAAKAEIHADAEYQRRYEELARDVAELKALLQGKEK